MDNLISLWHRYVDDTFTFIKKGEINKVLSLLNGFHKDIQFTHEVEKNNNIAFLDVKIVRKQDGKFITSIYRKDTVTNLYINWKAFSPKSWKIGTLKGMFRRAFLVCSEKNDLEKELSHLKFVFTKINRYPGKVVYSTLQSVKKNLEKSQNEPEINIEIGNNDVKGNSVEGDKEKIFPYMCLPYKGIKGEKILKSLSNRINKVLPNHVIPRYIFKGKKLGSYFSAKDRIKKEHQSGLIYGYYDETKRDKRQSTKYIGETNVRVGTRIDEHTTCKSSAIFKHAADNHLEVKQDSFEIIEKGYPKVMDRKIAEALYIKEFKPVLNEQIRSYKLQLFN